MSTDRQHPSSKISFILSITSIEGAKEIQISRSAILIKRLTKANISINRIIYILNEEVKNCSNIQKYTVTQQTLIIHSDTDDHAYELLQAMQKSQYIMNFTEITEKLFSNKRILIMSIQNKIAPETIREKILKINLIGVPYFYLPNNSKRKITILPISRTC